VFTSIWSYKVYYVYGFFLLVFCILTIVTSCVTVVGTYFLLNAENWRWQWTSFCGAASVSAYVRVSQSPRAAFAIAHTRPFRRDGYSLFPVYVTRVTTD
jgi:hypothetical protein